MKRIDQYKHLDEDPAYQIKIQLTMPELAKMVVAQNYGTHAQLVAFADNLTSVIHE